MNVHEGKSSTLKKPAKSPCVQPHLCPQCGHKASSKGALQIHIQVKHEGIRYLCPQCDYQATTKGSLRTHISSVNDPQKHLCPHCGFAANSNDLVFISYILYESLLQTILRPS